MTPAMPQIVRCNTAPAGAVEVFIDPEFTRAFETWSRARAQVVDHAHALCDALFVEIPRGATSRERGRLLRAKRAVHTLTALAPTSPKGRAGVESLTSVPAVAALATELGALLTEEELARDRVTRTIDEALARVAHAAQALLASEPFAATLAVASPDFATRLFSGGVPADADDRAFRSAAAFVKRVALKTSPFGAFTAAGPARSDDEPSSSLQGVEVARTVVTSLLLTALGAGDPKPGATVVNRICATDTGTDWLVPVQRVIIGHRPIRIESTGRPADPSTVRPAFPADTRSALAVGAAAPAVTLDAPAHPGGGDLRAAAEFLDRSVHTGPVVDDVRQSLLTLAEIVDRMSCAPGPERCVLARRLRAIVDRCAPELRTSALLYEHLAPPPVPAVPEAVSEQAARSVRSGLVADAEYLAFAGFARHRHGHRLDAVLAEYISLGGAGRLTGTVPTEELLTRCPASPTLANAFAASFLQLCEPAYVLNAVHTSAAGLIARHLDPAGEPAHALGSLLRSTADGAQLYQFTCWSDWIGTQAVQLPGVPVVRLPGDCADPNDGAARLSDFRIHCPGPGAVTVVGPNGMPAAFGYVGVVPYGLLSGFPRMLALLSAPWVIDESLRVPAVDERPRARWFHRAAADLQASDAVDTIAATAAWLDEASIPDEFFAAFVSPGGIRTKPQWYCRSSPVCLLQLARATAEQPGCTVEFTECLPARGSAPVTEHVVPHVIEVRP